MSEEKHEGRSPDLQERYLGIDDDGVNDTSGPPVGRADADADAARSGAAPPLGHSEEQDQGQVPTGADDADADARRTGADPDDA